MLGGPRLGFVTSIEPDVCLAHFAQDAALDQFDGAAESRFRRTLIAHLRDHFGGEGGFAEDAGFAHRAGERLFAEDVFAVLHGRHGGDGMGVIRRRDHHGIDLPFHGVEHSAEIGKDFGRWMLLVDVASTLSIDITQGHEVLAQAGKVIEVAATLAAHADAGKVQFAVGLVGPRQSGVLQDEQS